MRYITHLLFLLTLVTLSAQGSTVITTTPAPFKADRTADYFTQVIRLALDKTIAKYGEYQLAFSRPMYSTPLLLEVSRPNGQIDILWTGSSNKREKLLKPIRIPLVKGALGTRSALVHKRLKSKYESIKTLDHLRQFSVCQGQAWPDGDILEANGVRVQRYKNFEPMIEAVYSGQCDIFLRGIHEAPSEIAQRSERYPDLVLIDKVLINYPLPMYFFVGNYNPDLHKRMSTGLEAALSDGSLEQLMHSHPITKHLFPWEKWQASHKIKLKNPFLKPLPEIYHSSFWLKLD